MHSFLQGAYRDDDCKPVVLNVVREAESRVAGSNFMEYLPMGGMKAFTDLSVQLAFGEDAVPIKEGRVAAVQTLSGTGIVSDCAKVSTSMKEIDSKLSLWCVHSRKSATGVTW